MQNKEESEAQVIEEVVNEIAEQLAGGKNRTAVVQDLVKAGLSESEAHQTVERIFIEMKKAAAEEEFSGDALVPAILGGVLAAVIGGAAWAGIGIATDSELGLVAWAIGLICGLGVVMFAGGKKGFILQVVAVVTSVLGIAIGKYGFFYHLVQQDILSDKNGGPEVAAQYSLFSADMLQLFMDGYTALMGPYDFLWVGLAVFTAWGIPKASGLKT